jgi:hypothetical protein
MGTNRRRKHLKGKELIKVHEVKLTCTLPEPATHLLKIVVDRNLIWPS